MAATYANIAPIVQTDGVPYASAKTLTSSEASIFNQSSPLVDPIAVGYGEGVVVVAQLTATGAPATNSTYLVLQTDNGDGVWVDVAWCLWIGTSSTVTFFLSGGLAGANSVQQSRASGTAPGSNGSNQIALGGRLRIVGKAALTGGTNPAVTVTATYKILPLR